MQVAAAAAAFAAGAVVSLGTSWVLVTRLERVGERLGLSEALLGIVAALAADAPEITAAVAAIASRHQRLGAGVVIGSNVFNLAALLGLGAVVAGRVGLHRKVVALSGAVGIAIACCCLAAVAGLLEPPVALALTVVVLAAYTAVLATDPRRLGLRRIGRLRLPRAWAGWLASAVTEEELELQDAIRPGPAGRLDIAAAVVALPVVVIASITMERAASDLGTRFAVPEIVIGGLVLAAVTSLPNAVAAVYLAGRGRGAAMLSTALNSNALNVAVGLLIPASVAGLAVADDQSTLIALWYAGFTVAVVAIAYRDRGLGRAVGLLIIASYAVFTVSLLVLAYTWPDGVLFATVAGLAAASAFAARLIPRSGGRPHLPANHTR